MGEVLINYSTCRFEDTRTIIDWMENSDWGPYITKLVVTGVTEEIATWLELDRNALTAYQEMYASNGNPLYGDRMPPDHRDNEVLISPEDFYSRLFRGLSVEELDALLKGEKAGRAVPGLMRGLALSMFFNDLGQGLVDPHRTLMTLERIQRLGEG